MFKAAIAIMQLTINQQNEKRITSLYDIVEFLKRLPPTATRQDVLIDKLLKVELNDK